MTDNPERSITDGERQLLDALWPDRHQARKFQRHCADLYHDDDGVIPTCHCGWEVAKVPTYDEAAEAYAQHRMETTPKPDES